MDERKTVAAPFDPGGIHEQLTNRGALYADKTLCGSTKGSPYDPYCVRTMGHSGDCRCPHVAIRGETGHLLVGISRVGLWMRFSPFSEKGSKYASN